MHGQLDSLRAGDLMSLSLASWSLGVESLPYPLWVTRGLRAQPSTAALNVRCSGAQLRRLPGQSLRRHDSAGPIASTPASQPPEGRALNG